jgi:hypothetical protein
MKPLKLNQPTNSMTFPQSILADLDLMSLCLGAGLVLLVIALGGLGLLLISRRQPPPHPDCAIPAVPVEPDREWPPSQEFKGQPPPKRTGDIPPALIHKILTGKSDLPDEFWNQSVVTIIPRRK